MILENVIVRPFIEEDKEHFKALFYTYFSSDFHMELTQTQTDKICDSITKAVMDTRYYLDMVLLEDMYIGFIQYQIDNQLSDWCEREGWGFIREVHIAESFRGIGIGRHIVSHAEEKLYKMGVQNIYLTSDDASDFWTKCGYKDTNIICTINDGTIFEK